MARIGAAISSTFLLAVLFLSLFTLIQPSVSAYHTIALAPSGGDDTPALIDAILGLDDGGTVYFGAGTYHVNLSVIYFSDHTNDQTNPFLNFDRSFSLLGAGQGVTILDGDITGDGDGDGRILSLRRMGDNEVTLSGFTITNGSSDYTAGIYSSYCSLAISNCTIENNIARRGDGGMTIVGRNTVTVDNCTFNANIGGTGNGGGLSLNGASPTITDCTFVRNVAGENGGGMHLCNPSNPVIKGCTFIDNIAGRNGGGLFSGEESAPIVKNCTFFDNHAGTQVPAAPPYGDGAIMRYGYGGGMMITYMSTPIVNNCVFSGNTALWAGGGISSSNRYLVAPVITNCVFLQNEVLGMILWCGVLAGDTQAPPLVSAGGGGMFVGNRIRSNTSSPIVTNCTFTQNAVPEHDAYGEHGGENGGGVKNDGGTATFTNCIVWGNFPNDVLNTDGNESTFEYSNVGGGFTGTGNIDADPLFVSAPEDVSLRSASPCIDTGTDTSGNDYGGVTHDILGVSRPQRGIYDMGAYEVRMAWAPVVTQPLARTQLQSVLSMWEEIQGRLPDEPTDDASALIAQIQGHMANAAQLTNPIYASGQLSKAAAAMQQLAALLV